MVHPGPIGGAVSDTRLCGRGQRERKIFAAQHCVRVSILAEAGARWATSRSWRAGTCHAAGAPRHNACDSAHYISFPVCLQTVTAAIKNSELTKSRLLVTGAVQDASKWALTCGDRTHDGAWGPTLPAGHHSESIGNQLTGSYAQRGTFGGPAEGGRRHERACTQPQAPNQSGTEPFRKG
jgi:hypothetical protein